MAIFVSNPSTVSFAGVSTEPVDPALVLPEAGFTEELALAMRPRSPETEAGPEGAERSAQDPDEPLTDLQILPPDVLLHAVGDANFALAALSVSAKPLVEEAQTGVNAGQLPGPSPVLTVNGHPAALAVADAHLPSTGTLTNLETPHALAQAGVMPAEGTAPSPAAASAVGLAASVDSPSALIPAQNWGLAAEAAQAFTGKSASSMPSPASTSEASLPQELTAKAPGLPDQAVKTAATAGASPDTSDRVAVMRRETVSEAVHQAAVLGVDPAAGVDALAASPAQLAALSPDPIGSQAALRLNTEQKPNAVLPTALPNEAQTAQRAQTGVQVPLQGAAVSASPVVSNVEPALNHQGVANGPSSTAMTSTSDLVPAETSVGAQKSPVQADDTATSTPSYNTDLDTQKERRIEKARLNDQAVLAALPPDTVAKAVLADDLGLDAQRIQGVEVQARDNTLVGKRVAEVVSDSTNVSGTAAAANPLPDVTPEAKLAMQTPTEFSIPVTTVMPDRIAARDQSFDEVSSTFVSSLVGGPQRPVTTVMDWVALQPQERPAPVEPHEVRLDGGAVQVEIQRLVKQGGGHIVMELTPPDQSKFTIELKLDDRGGAFLLVEGVSDSTRTRLEQSAAQLHEQFQQMGLNLQLDMRQHREFASSGWSERPQGEPGAGNQPPELSVAESRAAASARAREASGSQIYLYA